MNKGQESNPKKYRGKKTRNNPILDPKEDTYFQGRCTDLEGYILDLGPRASKKFDRTIKELDRFLRKKYSDSFHPDIVTETAATFPNPEMPIITDLGTDRPKIDAYMTYLEKKNTNESIRQNMRKKDAYK